MAHPLAYFITFTCYGSHLHGEGPGSLDRKHNAVGARHLAPDAARHTASELRMRDRPYVLDAQRRETVLQSIQETSALRGWTLLAAHIRTSHIHVVLDADEPPEIVMHDLKAFATRSLREIG